MAESVKVVLRCRPFSKKEKDAGHSNIVEIDPHRGTVAVREPPQSSSSSSSSSTGAAAAVPLEAKVFTFDHTFDWNCTQAEVYDRTTRPLVQSMLDGYNATVFAYGQTGTGKTFSMQGLRDPPGLKGIIPCSFDQIFEYINEHSASAQFLVRISYLEIYNEEIRDLLTPAPTGPQAGGTKRLELKENKDKEVYVKDLTSFVVKSIEEMDSLMLDGNRNRSTGATLMNAESSRSHSIFTVTIEVAERGADGEEHIRVGKLNLVDLAGSERQSKTGATGDRLKEASKINLSLTALGNVIASLVDGKSSHVPYRDSKLTRLLQDSLGGNAKTLMIATMSPASYNFDETVSTLRYANRAKNIKNKPKINEDPKDAMLKEYQDEIARLKQQLESGQFAEEAEDDEGGEEEEEDEDKEDGEKSRAQRQKQKRSKQNSAPHAAAAISTAAAAAARARENAVSMDTLSSTLDAERQRVLASKQIADSEKQLMLQDLDRRTAELDEERLQKESLARKLAEMESKLLVGGENILHKAQQQKAALAQQQRELEERLARQREMEADLLKSQEWALQIEEEYSTLQDARENKLKKLQKLQSMVAEQERLLQESRGQEADEREALLDTLRDLNSELKLKNFLIEQVIPETFLRMILEYSSFDEDSETWRIAHVAQAGNNLPERRQTLKARMAAASARSAKTSRARPQTSRTRPDAGKPEQAAPEDAALYKVLTSPHGGYLSYERLVPPGTLKGSSRAGSPTKLSAGALNARRSATAPRRAASSTSPLKGSSRDELGSGSRRAGDEPSPSTPPPPVIPEARGLMKKEKRLF